MKRQKRTVVRQIGKCKVMVDAEDVQRIFGNPEISWRERERTIFRTFTMPGGRVVSQTLKQFIKEVEPGTKMYRVCRKSRSLYKTRGILDYRKCNLKVVDLEKKNISMPLELKGDKKTRTIAKVLRQLVIVNMGENSPILEELDSVFSC